MTQTPTVQSKAITLGFWAAVLSATFAVAFAILAVSFPAAEWKGIESYARSFNSLQMASYVPALLLAVANIVLMVSIHYSTSENQRIFSLMGIAFAIVYATIVITNYYVQLFVVRLNLLNGQLESLALLAMPNLHSAFFALETIGYCFLDLANLIVVPVFAGGRLASWIRGLFIVKGINAILGAVIAPFDMPVLIFAGLGLWGLLFPLSMVLVAIYFKKTKSRLL